MLEQLNEIATDSVDDLVRIKAERQVVAERLQLLEEEKSSVSEVVYDRVRADYQTQLGEMDREAAPLKNSARAEFAKLRVLLDEMESALAQTKLDREELELRSKLGEFEKADYQARAKTLDERGAAESKDLQSLKKLKQRFVAAFESEEELDAPPAIDLDAVDLRPPAEEGPAKEPEAEEAQSEAAEADEASPEEGSAKEAPSEEVSEKTAMIAEQPEPEQKLESGGAEAPSLPPPPPVAKVETPKPPPLPQADAGSTVMLSKDSAAAEDASLGTVVMPNQSARLAPADPQGEEQEFVLLPITTIGRTPQNQLQILQASVSRQHAQVVLAPTGYVVKDLGSENGTYVNGERIEEKVLSDGDRLQFGTKRYVFSLDS